jgi:hypothetical protein
VRTVEYFAVVIGIFVVFVVLVFIVSVALAAGGGSAFSLRRRFVRRRHVLWRLPIVLFVWAGTEAADAGQLVLA